MNLLIKRFTGVIGISVIAAIGSTTIEFIRGLGKLGIFFAEIIKSLLPLRFYWRIFLKQLMEIGYYSLPVIGLTAIFTGAALALQSYTGFVRMNAESAIASVVALSITRELGPVLAGLMLSGRVSASITAEIGSMKVTEQIDALYTLGANPIHYLVIPRVIAGLIALPCLVLVADIIGILGGYLVAIYKLDFSAHVYLTNTISFIKLTDITSGLIKAVVFGFIVTFIGCYFGFHSKGGAQGVGHSTTSAVAVSSILILVMNYITTGLLFSY
ncbi:MAG: Permease subunit MlaE of the ABC-type intermembrane phospholipid transporter Mla [Candidatus Midichloria mitochondrii]|uniref:ABC transporter permease protein n=1 Tax=Midichloria mitochondrii (strain IricVA) TaxID=696127 RepID=F7XV28_MIDMI|nr:ABC transporter permease protein [Candidatus Midichloria mitochondrii IricVA]